MSFYLSGVIVSYAIFVILLIVRLLGLSSKSTEILNMQKIGKKYNWVEGTYYSDDKYELDKKSPIKSFIKGLFLPLLSWIWVIILIYAYFHGKSEEKNLPNKIKEQIKEIQFKIKHTELSKRQIECLQNKMVKLLGGDFEKQYTLESGEDWFEYLTVKKDTTIWEHDFYSDSSSHNKNISQYKVEGTKVYEKTIDDWREFSSYEKGDDGQYHNVDEVTHYIKDGAATDEHLRYNENSENRKELTERHELENMQYIPYILYNYDELSDNDFKDYLRECIKNVSECWKEVEEFYKKNEIGYEKNISTKCEEGEELYFIDTYYKFKNKKKEKDKFYKDLEKITKKYNCVGCDIGSLRKKGKGKIEPKILGLYRKFLNDDI